MKKEETEKNFLRRETSQKEQSFPSLVVDHPPVGMSGSTLQVTAVTPG